MAGHEDWDGNKYLVAGPAALLKKPGGGSRRKATSPAAAAPRTNSRLARLRLQAQGRSDMELWRIGAALLTLFALGACQSVAPPQAQVAQSNPPLPPPPPAPLPSVSIERLSEITRVLASDEFQGRSMGTVGEDRTIAYLSSNIRPPGSSQAARMAGGRRPCR